MIEKSEMFFDEKLFVQELYVCLKKHNLLRNIIPTFSINVFAMASVVFLSHWLPKQFSELTEVFNLEQQDTEQSRIIKSIGTYSILITLHSISKSYSSFLSESLAEVISTASYGMYIDKLNRLSLMQRAARDISTDHYNIMSSTNSVKMFISNTFQTITNFLEIIINLQMSDIPSSSSSLLYTFVVCRLFLAKYQSSTLTELRKNQDDDAMNASQEIDKIMRCHELIHLKHMLDHEDQHGHEVLQKKISSAQKLQAYSSYFDVIKYLLFAVTISVFFMKLSERKTLTSIGVYLYVLNLIDQNCENISGFIRAMFETQQDLRKPIELLKMVPDIQDNPGSVTLPSKASFEIEFKSVSLLTEDRKVLDDVSFKIASGSVTALVGPSGSGKSLITKLIARLMTPSSGMIYMDGLPIETISLSELRRSCAYLSQNPVILPDTIEHNVTYGQPNMAQNDVMSALIKASLGLFIKQRPLNIKSLLDGDSKTCSGGEKQRLSLAREMISAKPIIILDEATSALDASQESEVLREILKLYKQSTIIIVSHDLASVKDVDNILVVHDGSIEASGTHNQLIEHSSLYRTLWENQQELSCNRPC